MAKTPVRTGNSNDWGLRLKKAALVSYVSIVPHISKTKSGLVIFGAVAVSVPPPLGIITGFFTAVTYNVAAGVGQKALRSARRGMGYASQEDYDVLAEFNRLQLAGHRQVISVHNTQKTVFPAPEMR